jgi:hypothetical protein
VPRERVNSPDELRGGDRVEIQVSRGVIVADLLVRDPDWQGLVVTAPARTYVYALDGAPAVLVVRGAYLLIEPDAYGQGIVFIRRRSREDAHHQRVAETQR